MKRTLYALQCLLVMCMAVFVMAFAPPAQAQATGDYLENQVIDTIFRGQSTSLGTDIFVGLSTAACSDSSVGTEVSGGSYARVSVTRSLANWAGTQGAGTTVASTGTGGVTSNNNVITFPTPTAGWGVVTHVFAAAAASGSNILFCTALSISKTINNGDSVTFPAGSLTFTQQ
jgi:hypothetical protein